MKTFNRLLIVIIYILLLATLARLGVFTAIAYWLMQPTKNGATRLQAIIEIIVLGGVISLWVGMIKEALTEGAEENEQRL